MRLYDGGKEFADGIDRYSLVLPYPDKIAKKTGVLALGVGFNQGTGQTIVADSFEITGSGPVTEAGLGQRVSISRFDDVTRGWLIHVFDLWKIWTKDPNDESWNRLRRFLGK